jgi:serine/threonine protein kinase
VLTYLHTRKPPIVHRNLQPGNIRITPAGHVFVTGFGLAKVLHGDQGTVRAAHTDARTDIYSLGATLYASLSGRIPEDGLARAMGNTQLTPLRKHNPKTSRRLAVTIEKAMAIDPGDRFQTAEDFKRALVDIRKGFKDHIW